MSSGRELDIRWASGMAGSVRRAAGTEARASEIRVVGQIERGGPMDDLLGAHGRSDAELVGAIHERFGPAGFLRLHGPFAAAIAGEELCLLRSPGFGAEPAIFFGEAREELRFSTELADLAGERMNVEALRGWLEGGILAPAPATPFEGVSALPPGAVLVISGSGRRMERFWRFTPPASPRRSSEAEARAEIEGALRSALAGAPDDPDLDAEAPGLELLRSSIDRGRPSDRVRDFDQAALERAYRAIAWPVALSEAAEVAGLSRSDRPLVTDLGMREVLAAMENAPPSAPSASGSSDRGLVRSRLSASLLERPRNLGARRRNPPGGERSVGPLDPGVFARYRAIARARPIVAPFLDRRVIEVLFSLRLPHVILDDRDPTLPRYPDDHPFRHRPRRYLSALERHAGEDRWLGLGAFLQVWDGAWS